MSLSQSSNIADVSYNTHDGVFRIREYADLINTNIMVFEIKKPEFLSPFTFLVDQWSHGGYKRLFTHIWMTDYFDDVYSMRFLRYLWVLVLPGRPWQPIDMYHSLDDEPIMFRTDAIRAMDRFNFLNRVLEGEFVGR